MGSSSKPKGQLGYWATKKTVMKVEKWRYNEDFVLLHKAAQLKAAPNCPKQEKEVVLGQQSMWAWLCPLVQI